MSRGGYPHTCGWEGIDDLAPEQLIVCYNPTIGYARSKDGRRVYCCVRHTDWAQEITGTGVLIREIRPDDTTHPLVYHARTAHA